MPRQKIIATQNDFRGGLNSNFSEDLLDGTEYRVGSNMRALQGELEFRAGSQRLHDSAIGAGAAIKGLYQWDAPLGRQVVGIAAGKFYHKLYAATDFTEVTPGVLLTTTDRATFAPYRIGGNVKVLIADGASLRSWDGTTLATISGSPNADRALIYKLRAWAIDGTKKLHFAKIGDPTKWTVADGGGSIDIETYNDAQNMGIIGIGSSLLIYKADNVARLTNVDTNNIRVDVETEGISGEVGLIAPNALCRFGEVAFFLSDKGPHLATETGVKEIGFKVHKSFDFGKRELWQSAQAEHNRRRNEIWLSLGAPSSADSNIKHTWIYNYLTGAWSGPFKFSNFDPSVIARYQRSDGTESIMVGGFDGFVRDADVVEVGSQDDVLRNGTGGNACTKEVAFADLTGGDPSKLKTMREANTLVADLGAAGTIDAYCSSELLTTEQTVTLSTKGTGAKQYRYKLDKAKGSRIVHGFRSTSSEICRIIGAKVNLTLSRGIRE